MKLTDRQKRFIKNNQDMLKGLFEARVEELERLAGNLDPNLTAEEFKIKYLGYKNFINEMRAWLKTIKILTQKNKPDSGV